MTGRERFAPPFGMRRKRSQSELIWSPTDATGCQIYHAALLRPVEDRSAFLKESCNGDEVLRQQVESLLEFESVSSQFLEMPGSRNRWRRRV